MYFNMRVVFLEYSEVFTRLLGNAEPNLCIIECISDITASVSDCASLPSRSHCRSVVLNLWVATQNWVAGNIPMGREYFIKITLFFILDEL
jgi:hypothetical protein